MHSSSKLPVQGTVGSAGWDLYAFDNYMITRHRVHTIRTGIRMKIPFGYFGMITPRSGLSQKYGFTIVNSPGIIDSDYRGEIKILGTLLGDGFNHMEIEHGHRIAQILFLPIPEIHIKAGVVHSDTDRGTGGFGSTGNL